MPWRKKVPPREDLRTEKVVARLESVADQLADTVLMLEARLREEEARGGGRPGPGGG